LRLVNEREGQVAYAVPSSLPYSWQNSGDFLNYGQWERGATWAIADYYLGSSDDAVQAEHPKMSPASNPQPRPHEAV
jgi:hypothetical protein